MMDVDSGAFFSTKAESRNPQHSASGAAEMQRRPSDGGGGQSTSLHAGVVSVFSLSFASFVVWGHFRKRGARPLPCLDAVIRVAHINIKSSSFPGHPYQPLRSYFSSLLARHRSNANARGTASSARHISAFPRRSRNNTTTSSVLGSPPYPSQPLCAHPD